MKYLYICVWSRLRLTFCTGTCVLLLYSVCKEFILLFIFRLLQRKEVHVYNISQLVHKFAVFNAVKGAVQL